MKKIRYGIIGVGNIGTVHLKNFMNGEIADAEVVALADINPQKVERACRQYEGHPFACYGSGDELIERAEVDAVIIAVPHFLHPPLAIAAMEKGIAVVCEKPAGVYTAQVKEMNRAADRTGTPFTMMFNQRTNCVYRKMREMILGGELGELKRISWMITNWYRPQSYYDSGAWRATWAGEGGGVLFNQCPHQLDLLQWVTGQTPVRVQAFCHCGKWHSIEVEDDVTAYLEFSGGATGTFITSTADAPGTNRFEVAGSMGKLVCEDNALTFYRNRVDEREFNRENKQGFGAPEYDVLKVGTDGVNLQHIGILRNFTQYLLGREKLFVDGREGLKSVELMDAMELSSWTGKMVALPIDDGQYYRELQKRMAVSRWKEVSDRLLDAEGTY